MFQADPDQCGHLVKNRVRETCLKYAEDILKASLKKNNFNLNDTVDGTVRNGTRNLVPLLKPINYWPMTKNT